MKTLQRITSYKLRTVKAFTLVEMIVVVAVITILMSIVVTTAMRLVNKGKEQLTESTIGIVTAALEQFKDYGYQYYGNYDGLKFPLDDTGCSLTITTPGIFNLQNTLQNALTTTIPTIVSFSGANNTDTTLYSCEMMYLFLSRVPTSRETLGRIDRSQIIANGTILINGQGYPWMRIVDAWGTTLRYSYFYYDAVNNIWVRRNFPLVTSAGQDKVFGTPDDITSK